MKNAKLNGIIHDFKAENIPSDRKQVLVELISYIQDKITNGEPIRLNFICTHNSRRSHLSQIWAQTMAFHCGIKDVVCYSGGTKATAMFPKVVETLDNQGFEVIKLSDTSNPVYALKYDENEQAILCFSKEYHHDFNPKTNFGAVVTCDSADEACPIVFGAEIRIPIKYDDPKLYDNTELMDEKYEERSLEIGQEMWYVFNEVKNQI